jgi:hypothetical protein
MKGLLFVIISFIFTLENSFVVEEFHQLKTKNEEISFLKKYANEVNPNVQAYVCALEMKQAKYFFNPIAKIRVFRKTKNKLELLIKNNPNNIDLRYVRLMLQERIPSILGYHNDIETDKVFLKDKLKTKKISKKLEKYIHKNTSL